MLLLTLVMLVLIEAMYILYLKLPSWGEEEYAGQTWMVSMLCRELAIIGSWLLGLFWMLKVVSVLGY